MLCCLNPDCQNPLNADDFKFCQSCGTPLVLLGHRYRPIKPLGSGGFSKTYLAEDINKLNEHCVIKQLAPQVEGSSTLQKARKLFEQEAKRLQQLGEHPQIPTLFAYLEQDKHLYLVQEYIEGQTLEQELTLQGIFSEQQVREVLLDLLNILKFVHEHGVIHRDIKPENIIRRSVSSRLVGETQKEGTQLVLIDFGIAKQLTATVLAKTGTSIGSFGYVAMEQMEAGEAYPASDLYSLGATCFHLLTGVHPWELWKKQGYSWVSTWRQHLKKPVSQELWWIMDRLLVENHKRRYQSVEKVLEQLKPQPSPRPSRVSKRAFSAQALLLKPVALAFLVGFAIVLGMGGTQLYRYVRYGWFPATLITSVPSSTFLKTTLIGHTKWVSALAMTPDGQTLVSGSGNGTINIWNLNTDQLKFPLSGSINPVTCLAISSDGQTLVIGSEDNSVKVWNLSTGQLTFTLNGESNSAGSLAMTPDGQTIVRSSYDGTIQVWNLSTAQLKNTLTWQTNSASSLTITPDGQTLASWGDNQTIKVWNLSTGQLKPALAEYINSVSSLAMTPDGQTLVSGNQYGTIKIWNLNTGQLKSTITGHTDSVSSLVISPDGQTLVSGSSDKTIKIWNLSTGQLKQTLIGHTSTVWSLAMTPDGQRLVSGSGDTTIKIWRMP